MKIGLFTDAYSPYISGVVTSVLLLKKALEDMGHTVYVVTINMNSKKYEYDELEKVLRVPGINSGVYDGVKVSAVYPLGAISKVKKWNLDVIHSHTEGSIGTFARIVSKQFNIPIVHTYHTMYEDYIYLINKGYFDKPVKKIVEYLTLFYCDKTVSELIVPTKKAYDLFKEKYKLDRNIHIVPTGNDIEKFDKNNFTKKQIFDLKKKIGISHDDFVLICISRISHEKNIDFLIDTHKLLVRKNKKIKLLIIGDGPDFDRLKKKASRVNNGKSIIFTGKVPWDDVPLYYQTGDVFVTASKTETQGLTVNEALCSSLPVVCIDDDSFKLSVMDGFNGFFFKNKKEYQDNILTLIKEKKLYTLLSKQAKNSSLKFSTKYFGENILNIYKMAALNKRKNIIEKIKELVVKE